MKAKEFSKTSPLLAQLPAEMRSFFQDIVDSAPGWAALITTGDMQIVTANTQFRLLTGYPQTEQGTSQKSFAELLDEDALSAFRDYLNLNLLDAGMPVDVFETRMKTVEGEQKRFHTYISPVFYKGQHQTDYALVVLHSKHSKSEGPLGSPEARECYLEQFKDEIWGILEWKTNSNVVCFSDSMNSIFETEFESDEMPVEKLVAFVCEHDRTRFSGYFRDAANAPVVIRDEIQITTGKNNLRILRATGRIYDTPDCQRKLVVCIKDITQARQIEQSYHKKVEELANSNAELEEFAYVASHDLQEPLRKISTFCSRLDYKYSNQLDAEGKMYLERALVSAENMRLLINDLLEFSRISKTKQPFESVDLNLIFRIVRTDFELSIEESGCELRCEQLPVISGIKTQLVQLFSNLVSNAIKFRTTDDKPVVRIFWEWAGIEEKTIFGLAPQKAYVKIKFEDNGIGFDNIYASRIFQVFQRLHGRTEYAGSGIGLAICKKIAEHHHGTIFAVGQIGNGATFTVLLPYEQ